MKFNIAEALDYARKNEIDEWINIFLMTDGDNHILARELKEQKPYFTGPIEIPIDKLDRCMGPEPYM